MAAYAELEAVCGTFSSPARKGPTSVQGAKQAETGQRNRDRSLAQRKLRTDDGRKYVHEERGLSYTMRRSATAPRIFSLESNKSTNGRTLGDGEDFEQIRRRLLPRRHGRQRRHAFLTEARAA